MKGPKQKGFSLVELVVAATILSVMAYVAMPFVEAVVKRKQEERLASALREIRSAIDSYKDAYDRGEIEKRVGDSGYPASLDLLVDGVKNVKSPSGGSIYFLRRIPRDPMYPDKTVPPAKTWGLRAYQSSAESPKPGADVFDVYSLSEKVGINGIPYREW